MGIVELAHTQHRLKQIAIERHVTMKRIRQRLARRHRSERARVDELTEHRESGARAAHRRLFRVEQKINTCLDRRAAPKRDVSRLVSTRDPERFSILYVTANVSGVCARDTRDNDRLD